MSSFDFAARSNSRQYSQQPMRRENSSLIDNNDVMSIEHFVRLNARLIQAQIRIRAAERRWLSVVYRANKLQVWRSAMLFKSYY
jgi:hypothetical protein